MESIYTNPRTFSRNPRIFLDRLLKTNPNDKTTLKEVKEFLDSKVAIQRTKTKKKKKSQVIHSPRLGWNYSMDLVVYTRFSINNYKYILCVIDIYSRYAFCYPLTNKRPPTVLKGIELAFKKMGTPVHMNLDKGTEFKGVVKKYLDSLDVQLWLSDPDDILKNSIVERFNRTLITNINVYRLSSGNKRWNDYLDDIVQNYNESPHSGIQQIPIDVFQGYALPVRKQEPTIKNPLRVGDYVRVKEKRKTFSKGDNVKYSAEVYQITAIVKNRYTLDVLGKNYKDSELLRVTKPKEKKIVSTVPKIVRTIQTVPPRSKSKRIKKPNKKYT